MKFRLLALTFFGTGLLAVSGVARANLISNGGFESGSFAGWATSGLTCSGVGANFSAATGCVGYDGDPGPFAGSFAAYLGTAAGGGVISQSFATEIGYEYQVSFYLANGAYQNVATPNNFSATINGDLALFISNVAPGGYRYLSFLFTATATNATLAFTHRNQPSFFILDNVSATRVPEPAMLALLGFGLAGLALVRRRR